MPELQEVVLLPPEEKGKEEPAENPFGLKMSSDWTKMTQGVTITTVAGGIVGAFACGVVPKVLKWNTGVKDVIASLATTLAGGLILGKVHKQAAYGFVMGGGIVTAIKAIRLVMTAKPFGTELKLMGDGVGDNLIYGEDDYDEFFGADEDIFTEQELFGIGEDPIVPTAGFDDLW